MTVEHETPHSSGGGTAGSTRRRLPPHPGEWIDRERPIRFRFEGCTYYGLAGDTISSALAANGVRMLGRSFKYHRPRGIYSLANHDVNVLVTDGTRTNLRADVTPVWEGAELTAVNTFGGLQNDLARHTDKAGRFLPVGFYYKTFHKPRKMFPFWERQMRAMAGLGAVDPAAPRLRTPKQYATCDVLVVGAGASGLSAAIAAAERGLRVLLVDEQSRAGGSLVYQGAGHPRAADTLQALLDRAGSLPNLEIRGGTVAAGYYADHWVALVDEHRLVKLRARAVVFATGVYEQPALFRNNDLPGVMLASAAQRLMHLYAVKPFDRPIVLAANTEGYRAALDMRQHGIAVRMLVDLRPTGEPTGLGRRVAEAGIPISSGHAVYEANQGGEATGIDGVTVCPLGADGQPIVRGGERIACDGLVMSVGWAPADSLFCQARGKMKYARALEQFVPGAVTPGIFVCGRLNGLFDVDRRQSDGRRAGSAAADWCENPSGFGATAPVAAGSPVEEVPAPPSHAYPVIEHPSGKIFVDLDEDVQLKDIEHAVQEGFDGVELLKRYSTFGMGPSQGKIANTNTIRVLARLRGQSMEETGAPTARPFVHPVPLSHLAGRGFHVRRETALHARHRAAGAQFMPAGDWLRPAYYATNGLARERAIVGEVEAVRQRAGLIDVGTLGKLEIAGPDAAEFLERIYTGRFARMKTGTTRYGLMCDESGVVIDDGVIGRLAEDRFYVTTTTTASGSVYREMQRWALIWRLNVVLANVTGAFAAMNLAGPQARTILSALGDIDTSERAFPYLGLRETDILGVPCRILRTGFVGEVGYEIHAPAQWAIRLWDGMLQAGSQSGIRPFGVEAQRVLRLEKGHVIVGQDTDGLTTPYEAGMAWAVKDDKPFFIGGRSLRIIAEKKPLKRQLVGFTLPPQHTGPLPSECHLVIDRGEIAGRVTSIVHSPTLRQAIGLAYVRPAQAQPGTRFQIRGEGGRMIEATVVELPFYDRSNARQTVFGAIARRDIEGQSTRSQTRALAGLPSRASPVHVELQKLRPTWSSTGDMPIATAIGDAAAERSAAATLGLCDVSALARVTVKGPGAAEFLTRQNIGLPESVNECQKLATGGFVARTGRTEFFIEDGWHGDTVDRLRAALAASAPGVLAVWRQDASFLLTGSRQSALFAQVCSFDFRSTGDALIMTQVAGISCAVLPARGHERPAFQIWADGTYGPYLWTTLLGIARELGGDAVGTLCVGASP
ncbi:MAG TPA: FAD-dependent oxidoreductase [Pirellulales bacterium]|nr:FAD-dependent oxidoreductase [Pirellulales bacterium]